MQMNRPLSKKKQHLPAVVGLKGIALSSRGQEGVALCDVVHVRMYSKTSKTTTTTKTTDQNHCGV